MFIPSVSLLENGLFLLHLCFSKDFLEFGSLELEREKWNRFSRCCGVKIDEDIYFYSTKGSTIRFHDVSQEVRNFFLTFVSLIFDIFLLSYRYFFLAFKIKFVLAWVIAPSIDLYIFANSIKAAELKQTRNKMFSFIWPKIKNNFELNPY